MSSEFREHPACLATEVGGLRWIADCGQKCHRSHLLVDKAKLMTRTGLPQPRRERRDPGDPKVCIWSHEAFSVN